MVAQFRLKSKIKPRFVEWKNLALENYVAVNKAFAANQLASIQDSMSIWVYEALQQRVKSVPAGTRLEWKLVKFHSVPRIMAIQPMMLPDSPLTHVQIIYRIESRQKLVKVARGSDKVDTVERDVVDYVGYVFDAGKTPASVVMSGTVFESKFISTGSLLSFIMDTLVYQE
ncbi:Mba1p [Sugiyamaella lignohabitans]|uniref:Mba1p n=1 Tax=Sugiyamaella lignohabitans TaxID=796027 RepID=A0A167CZ54_9ASCO|nr:Mba1p [Sugiyamaella lignohabitans]ANB12282.1 Mba1p [Sugiyamaella lignohabitans]